MKREQLPLDSATAFQEQRAAMSGIVAALVNAGIVTALLLGALKVWG